MKYEVYYNMMGVLPVHNYFATKEKADAFANEVRAKGFEPTITEM